MKENIRTMVVDGDVYEIWTDVIARGTYAQCKKNGRVEKISSGRYISAISTVKKYIRLTF